MDGSGLAKDFLHVRGLGSMQPYCCGISGDVKTERPGGLEIDVRSNR